jgi:triacylglycerol lipase
MDKNRAYEMALLSQRAYLPIDEFQALHSDRRFNFHSVNGTQFYTVWTDKELIFAFRGTEAKFADIKADLKLKMEDIDSPHEYGMVHRGFKAALNCVVDVLAEDYNRLGEGRQVIFTGHSLGAALAILACSRLNNFESECFLYGAPRVGNADFRDGFNFRFDSIYRFINQNDVITRHPMSLWGYRHIGMSFYFDGDGKCVTNPNFWHRLKQFISGMYAGIESHKIDSFADHSVSNYVRLTKELE